MEPEVARKLDTAPGTLRSVIAETFLALARARRDAEFYAVALDGLAAEMRLRPGSYEAANNYAGVLFETGRFGDAVVALRQAITLNPELAEPHFNLGLALERLGRRGEALRSYEQAVRLRPDWTKAKERLGEARRSGS
jgi:tetratricopeptide (TPR) repeat protein